MNYFTNPKVKSGLPEEELLAAIKAFKDSIDETWLNKGNYHPLRALWKRDDILAANELYTFARSINKLSGKNQKWLRAQIKLVKSAEKNNYQGAFCELMALAMLDSSKHPITPANLNEAGYDAILEIGENKHFNVSIKNYGMSQHEQRFRKWCAKTEEIVKRLLKKYKYYPATILIDSPAQYPTDEKWEMLHAHLDSMFKQQKDAEEKFSALATDVPEWIVSLSPHIYSSGPFHDQFSSYTLVITSPYHRNENDNLRSKIEEACANLSKHVSEESESKKNILFIHLPADASVKSCNEWLNAYFDEYPDKPISGVFLYQPSVVTDLRKSLTSLNHFLQLYSRKGKLDGWLPGEIILEMDIAVGTVSVEPAVKTLNFTNPDATTQVLTIDDRYFYQRGEHYNKMEPDGKGGFRGKIDQLSPGVFTNIVLEFPGQSERAAIKGRFPPSDQLLIV